MWVLICYRAGIIGEPLNQFNEKTLTPLGAENEEEGDEGEEAKKPYVYFVIKIILCNACHIEKFTCDNIKYYLNIGKEKYKMWKRKYIYLESHQASAMKIS